MKDYNIDVSITVPLYFYISLKEFSSKINLDKAIVLIPYHKFDSNNNAYVDISTTVYDLMVISALLRKSIFNGNNTKDYNFMLFYVNNILKKKGWI